jgi:hypothetical protein
MKDESVYNFTYQKLKEKTASSLESMQTIGVITEQESKADHNELVERIIDLVKEHK